MSQSIHDVYLRCAIRRKSCAKQTDHRRSEQRESRYSKRHPQGEESQLHHLAGLNAGGNAEWANPIRTQLGTPSSIDVIFAHALFTCHGGHPKPYLEYLIDRGDLPYSKEELEGALL